MTLKEFLLTQNDLENESLPMVIEYYNTERDEFEFHEVRECSIQSVRKPDGTNMNVIFMIASPMFEREEDLFDEEFEEVLNPESDDTMLGRVPPIEQTQREMGGGIENDYKIIVNNNPKQEATIKDLHDALINWNKPENDIVSMLSKPMTPKESVNPLTYEWGIFKGKQKGKEGGHVTKF